MRTFLNVGSGAKGTGWIPNWFAAWQEIRLDIDPDQKPDIVGTVTDMREVATASVDAVWAENIIEHLYAHEVPLALKEIVRVLKPDGHAEIRVPNLQVIAKLVVDDRLEDEAYRAPVGPISALDMLYGHRDSIAKGMTYMAHRTGFTIRTMTEALRHAGFADGQLFNYEFEIWAFAAKQKIDASIVPAEAWETLPFRK